MRRRVQHNVVNKEDGRLLWAGLLLALLALIALGGCREPAAPASRAGMAPTAVPATPTGTVQPATETPPPTTTASPTATSTPTATEPPTATPEPTLLPMATPAATAVTVPPGIVNAIEGQPTPTVLPLPTQGWEVRVPVEDAEQAATTAPPENPYADLYADAQLLGETEHFRFYQEEGAFTPPLEELRVQAEGLLEIVEERLQVEYDGRMELFFRPPDESACPMRGAATLAPVAPDAEEGADAKPASLVFIFTDEETSREQIYGVVAHEVAHSVHREELPPGNAALTEGLATWAAAGFQTSWYNTPSYDELVRSYLATGRYQPLHEDPALKGTYEDLRLQREDCLVERDILYSQWASFVGYLIEQYGWEKFRDLLGVQQGDAAAGDAVVRVADYEGVYGLSLNQLEMAWLQALVAGEEAR